MLQLLPMILGAAVWGYLTQLSTYGKYGIHKQPMANRLAFAMVVLSLALPVTLRTSYNDTVNYIRSFATGDTLSELLASGTLHPLRNPAFLLYSALIRTFTNNYSIFFLFPAFFVQYSYLRFIRKHSPNFLMGLTMYFCLGTYTFSMAAMKQTIAMAILLYAVDALIDRKHTLFYFLVFLAVMFHTYALVFIILPLFTSTPWTLRTFALLGAILFFMNNFEAVITSFMEVANESGKHVTGGELLGTASINPLRVAVYAVTPALALIFRKYLFHVSYDREHNILINMSIISVSIMAVGLVSAANMFARMAQYFEFGMICSLPWIINKPFAEESRRLMNLAAVVCFLIYFIYSHAFWMPFDDLFKRLTVFEFLENLWISAFYN